jgi:hypothetical protein
MTDQASVQAREAPIGWATGQAVDKAKHMGARLVEALAVCRASWEAAALYEDLSRLSDAELDRRGIPRDELHRRVCKAVTEAS